MTRTSCDGCVNDLGGSCCKANSEGECREGGGYELWRPKTRFRRFLDVGNYADAYMQGVGFLARQDAHGVAVEWGDCE